MTVRQCSQRLEVSPSLIYSMIAAGKLRCVRHGLGRGCIRISEEHLQEYLSGAEPKGAPPRQQLKHLHI